ncbi:MCE family protein [Actinomycetospora sp. TBRC 11914]|uniref:MCE family protein n=1 Tax=Actinomycetospora sp. TBRC 11914 TaxID=2729387 RepID=UPI00145CECC6|nr:MCE family protein [Actinomycetospora sp. TBRC 11914]NMO93390.1 MCE family protein [Actinomycetospora sp. TBRC 11914]
MTTRLTDVFDSLARTLAVVLIVALLATAGLWYALQRGSSRTITAYFTSVVGLYTKNTVDVNGVPVGSVEEIVPQGNVVRVTLKVDNKVPVAADAKAVIVAPTLVSDRYVQLGPDYTGGPMMNDGAVIPVQRTAVPVELDRVYKSLDQIATALGPNGANKDGALNRLLQSSAGALGGNGEAIKQTITQLAGAVGTLSDNRENLFATVDNLGQFTNMLARNDGQVRLLNNQLADFSGFLAAERGNLSQVLQVLPPALEDVASFVRDNRDGLHTDVSKLASITDILVRQQKALTETFDVAPLALSNLTNSYNAKYGTLDVRPVLVPGLNLPTLEPQALLCGLLSGNPLGGLLGTVAPGQLPTQVSQAVTTCAALSQTGATSLQSAVAPYAQLATLLNQNQAAAAAVGNVLQNATTAVAPAPTVADQPAPTQPGQGLLQGLTTR